ncbi:LiaI-LiaF-like domain-containing protein [Bacteroidota bacterium]
MKYKNIFWGLILIILGALFILKNTGLLYFSWRDIFQLWPIILILWGLSIIPVKSGIKIILSVITITVAIFIISNSHSRWESHSYWEWGEDKDYEDSREWTDQEFTEPYDQNIKIARLEINAAAGSFDIKGVCDELIHFKHEGNVGPYEMKSFSSDSSRKIILDFEDEFIRAGRIKNYTEIWLNPNPLWSIDVDAGAAKLDLDLSAYKVEQLEIDGGATSVDVTLGSLLDEVFVSIDAGASSLTIRVPEKIGCKITNDSFLTSKRLKGFNKTSDGDYLSEDYEDYNKKIFIDINTAISSLKVLRY